MHILQKGYIYSMQISNYAKVPKPAEKSELVNVCRISVTEGTQILASGQYFPETPNPLISLSNNNRLQFYSALIGISGLFDFNNSLG